MAKAAGTGSDRSVRAFAVEPHPHHPWPPLLKHWITYGPIIIWIHFWKLSGRRTSFFIVTGRGISYVHGMLSEKPWTIERMLMMVFSMILCVCFFGLLQALAMHLTVHEKPDANSITTVIFLILSLHGSILLATTFVLWWCQVDWRRAFGISPWNTNRSLLWGALAGIIFLPIGVLLQAASLQLMKLLNW